MGPEEFHHHTTSASHLSISWARSMQFVPLYPTSCRSILILSSHLLLGLPSDSFPQASSAKHCTHIYILNLANWSEIKAWCQNAQKMNACWQNQDKENRSGVLAPAITVVQYLAEPCLAFRKKKRKPHDEGSVTLPGLRVTLAQLQPAVLQ
jgi:hypothetical protein